MTATITVEVNRDDVITAAGACAIAAAATLRQTKLRRNAGPDRATEREWLRTQAAEYREVGRRLQDIADNGWRP